MPETKIRIKVGTKAIKFEEGIKTSTGRLIPEECLKRRKGTSEEKGLQGKRRLL